MAQRDDVAYTFWANELLRNTYQVSKIGIHNNGINRACVEIQNDLTYNFEVNRGQQQGDGLAPLLFNIALGYALRQLSVDVNLSAHLHIRSNHWLCRWYEYYGKTHADREEMYRNPE